MYVDESVFRVAACGICFDIVLFIRVSMYKQQRGADSVGGCVCGLTHGVVVPSIRNGAPLCHNSLQLFDTSPMGSTEARVSRVVN